MKKKKPDYILLGATAALVLVGLLILASVSVFLAEKNSTRPYYFLLHQIIFGIILGGLLGFLFFKMPLIKLKGWSVIFLLVNIALLALVFLPGIGWSSGGASRWVKIGEFTFQPSELLKITFPLYLAAWLSKRELLVRKRKTRKKHLARHLVKRRGKIDFFKKNGSPDFAQIFGRNSALFENLIPFLIILALISLLLIFQPDIGTLAVIAGVALLMYFIANTSVWHNLLILLGGAAGFFLLIRFSPYRVARLLTFFNPTADPMGAGYQIKQALIAVGSGGIFGKGLGLSQQKLGFLPQPLGDSIFAIFAEETGFFGASLLILLFLVFLWRGLRITKTAQEPFFKLLSFGLTSQIILQALVNVCALIGLLPLTGIPLPFISYGGSHLVTELIGVGILLNISKQIRY